MQAQQSQFGQGRPMTTGGYPPTQAHLYPSPTPTASAGQSTSTMETKVDPRQQLSRTPSPTPSEQKELDSSAIDWKTISKPKFWFKREWLWYYIIFFVILVLTALITIYHTQIVHWLLKQNFINWLHNQKFGWLVPIGILFVISFPPLFGHEIVAILCGLVWGLWIGFGIVAAGTFVGEIGNFYAFKYCCRARGVKMEKNKMWYACLARVIRDGGFKIALIARLSAIPGHFTTAIFSTCGMGIITFSIAAVLSLPKQFVTVYLGVILDSTTSSANTKSKLISDAVVAITFIITFVAVWYLYRLMNKAKPLVIYDRRKARQVKLLREAGISPYRRQGAAASGEVFNPNGSDSDIPLTSNMYHQQWDAQGNAVGYVGDPSLKIVAPKPRTTGPTFIPLNNPRDVEEGGVYDVHGRNDSTYSVGWEAPTQHAGPNAYPNPYPAQRRNFAPDMGQTPTQATFVNNNSGADWRPGPSGHNAGPRQSFEDNDSDEAAYGGYEAVATPLVAGNGGGHYQESTGTTFATAYTNSPEGRHEDLPNPHYPPHLPQGANAPKPPEYSARRDVIR